MTEGNDNVNVYGVEFDIENCALSDLSDEFLGAFVVVYVCAATLREAVNKAENELLKKNHEIVSIEQAEILDSENWDDDAEGLPTWAELLDAKEKGIPAFSCYFYYDGECE